MAIATHPAAPWRTGSGVSSLLLAVALLLQCLPAWSYTSKDQHTGLAGFIAKLDVAQIYPGADRIGPAEGEPPVAVAYKGDQKLGLVFLTSDYVSTIGYSGKPIHQLVAINNDAVLQKVLLVEHHEPIVLVGIPEKRIVAVLDAFDGLDIAAIAAGKDVGHDIDVVTGATVTVMVMDDTVLRSASKVARAHHLGGMSPEPEYRGPQAKLNVEAANNSPVEGWQGLLADKSVQTLKLTLAQVNTTFAASGDALAAMRPEQGDPKASFIELYAAVVSIPAIGRAVLGEREYANLVKRLKPGQQAIALASNGRFSFKGSGYVRGGIFDRFRLLQGDAAFRFHDYQHKRLRHIAAKGAPRVKDVDLFLIPLEQGFNPAHDWRLELLVGRDTGPRSKAFETFNLDYQAPPKYITVVPPEPLPASFYPEWFNPDAPDAPLWMKIWVAKFPQVAVLLIALLVLSVIFFFQDWLVKRPKLTDRVRLAFMVFTLFGIGWYANAQLSVVNILAVLNALVSGFDWGYFLMEPLIFILWGSVAVALLFWARGPYCGWLCPFGALQELINRVAKWVRIPQWHLPWGLHERLWPIKYLIFLLLFGVSLHSLGLAEKMAEVEPFKTAIILKFAREWPFVVFALAMLIPGLFIERFYCRYLCPLGAALAIPGRLRMFQWLKRYKECGSPCQRCRKECMVQAIHPEGQINVNECVYCLHCQVVYSDDHACPVLVQKRLKRERRSGPKVGTKATPLTMRIEALKQGAVTGTAKGDSEQK